MQGRAPRPAGQPAPITGDLVPEPARLLGASPRCREDDEGEFLLYAGFPDQIVTGTWVDQGFPHFGVLEYSQPVTIKADYWTTA